VHSGALLPAAEAGTRTSLCWEGRVAAVLCAPNPERFPMVVEYPTCLEVA
jgi:hypothetical protein